MASTYELYLGGPRQQNTDWAIFPAAAFSANNEAAMAPAQKRPVVYGVSRTLDFTNDTALSYFFNTTLAGTGFVTNDELGAVVIPGKSLFLGCWYSVNTPVTGGVFSLIIRAVGTTLVSGISTTTATSAWAPYVAAGNVTTGVHYFATPDIVDIKFTTVPGANLGALSITITPVYVHFEVGQN